MKLFLVVAQLAVVAALATTTSLANTAADSYTFDDAKDGSLAGNRPSRPSGSFGGSRPPRPSGSFDGPFGGSRPHSKGRGKGPHHGSGSRSSLPLAGSRNEQDRAASSTQGSRPPRPSGSHGGRFPNAGAKGSRPPRPSGSHAGGSFTGSRGPHAGGRGGGKGNGSGKGPKASGSDSQLRGSDDGY